MTERLTDGSAGDVDYGTIGQEYSKYRQPEPRIAALIHEALGKGSRILNVGAGAGSYEPVDRQVTAIEPSASMRAQPARVLVLLLLVPLALCGLGLVGFGWLYTSVEVQRPAPIIEAPAAVPAEVQTPEEAPVEPEAN